MIFKLVFKEMIKNPINIIINIGLVTMFFVIIIGIISFSMQLPVTFKSNFFKENTKFRIELTDTLINELENSSNYELEMIMIDNIGMYYYFDESSSEYVSDNFAINFTNDIKYVYDINSSEYIYIPYSFAFYNDLNNDDNIKLTSYRQDVFNYKVRILEKTEKELDGIYSNPETNLDVYLSYKSFNDYYDYSFDTFIIIRDIYDFEAYYQLLVNHDLVDIYGDRSILSIYRAYRTGEMLLYSLAFLCIFLSAFILYSMMDIIIMKKEKYIGLLKSFGYDNKKVFLLYFILIEMILIISLLISSIILELYYNYINQMIASSLSIFVNLQTNFLTILIAFSGFNLLFILFFIRIFRKIKNNSILTFLKAR